MQNTKIADISEINDQKLLDLFFNENKKQQAFNDIMKKYQERLYWHIRKIVIIHEDANDILQNTFVKAWRYLPKFEQKSKLYTWLYRIATNESISFINSKKKKAEESFGVYENYLANTLTADSYFDGDEIQLILQKAILTLPEKQRIVFNMKYFDEMKYKDMSVILNTSEGALKSSYHHAVKKIEKFIKSE